MSRRYSGLVIAAGCLIACRGGDAHRTVVRVWEHGSWRAIGAVVTDPAVLDRPVSMALGPGASYVFNGGDRTIVAVAPDGRALWRFSPADSLRFHDDSSVALAADSSGRVYVADLYSGHIIVLSPLGSVERVLRIHARLHLAPRGDGWFWGASVMGAAPSLFDSAGHRYLTLRVPPALGAAQYARGDARLAVGHDTLVVAYMWGGHFLVVSGSPPTVRDVPAIEPRTFGRFKLDDVTVGNQTLQAYRADSTDQPATLSMAVDGGLIYALYWNVAGPVEDRRRTVDIYGVKSGAYDGSRRLPLPCKEIAVRGDTLHALTSDGALRTWQWTADSATAPR